jgi:hypothetical protein
VGRPAGDHDVRIVGGAGVPNVYGDDLRFTEAVGDRLGDLAGLPYIDSYATTVFTGWMFPRKLPTEA